MRIRPVFTLDDRPRSANLVRVRANNVRGVTSLRIVSTSPPPPVANPAGGPQLANQVLANDGTTAQQLAGVDGVAIDNVVDVDGPVDADFITLANPFGSGGECRHNLHCHGSERCVRRNGKYKCTTRYCNIDSDCRDGQLCRDQRCRRCTRCRDLIQAPNPK